MEKHHLYANTTKLLKALLGVNSTGVFNKSIIAEALHIIDVSGDNKAKRGPTWAMDSGW